MNLQLVMYLLGEIASSAQRQGIISVAKEITDDPLVGQSLLIPGRKLFRPQDFLRSVDIFKDTQGEDPMSANERHSRQVALRVLDLLREYPEMQDLACQLAEALDNEE